MSNHNANKYKNTLENRVWLGIGKAISVLFFLMWWIAS